jgi:hypothetical protein
MSLLDSLLGDQLASSEVPSPMKEVWLAIRTDGNGIGDGSRENPFAANTPTRSQRNRADIASFRRSKAL